MEESHSYKSGLDRLCIHTQTHRPWSLRQCAEAFSDRGIRHISVWRHLLEDLQLSEARQILEDHGMNCTALVRGGFFASADESGRQAAIDNNLRAIEEAEALDAGMLVLVCGADPAQSQQVSRDQIREGIARILPAAKSAGMNLAVEPLHPLYAADRSAITSMKQANDLCDDLNSDSLGVAVDVFHLWWDPDLAPEIARCGKAGRLSAFHICDWKPDMKDMLNDRGLMGEGCIDLKQIRHWMEEAGFRGPHEVEIFSDHYWSMDQDRYLDLVIDAYYKYKKDR